MRKQINFKNLRIKSLSLLAMLVCALAVTHFLQTAVSAETGNIVYSVIEADIKGANLYTVTTNGIPVELTQFETDYFDFSPVWSPDKSKVAFIREYIYGTTYLMIIDADGHNETTLYQNEFVSDPTWSPDGSKIAFTLGNDSTFLGRLYNSCGRGKGGKIASIVVDTKAVTVFSNTLYGTDPSWSPDGNTIAFVKTRVESGIYSLNAASGAVTLLINESAPADPDWSADGTKLVYGRNYQDAATCNGGMKTGGLIPAPIYGGEIVVHNFSAGTSQVLVSSLGSAPDWSPTGSNIVFSSSVNSTHQLFTVNSSGGTPIFVPNTQNWATSSSW